MVLFSLFTIVPLANSVAMFAALRLIAGLGLGACMPVSLTMMAEHMPASRRARASTLTMTGYHTGAVITSLLALQVTDNWEILFYLFGVVGLVVAAVQWFKLRSRRPSSGPSRTGPAGAVHRTARRPTCGRASASGSRRSWVCCWSTVSTPGCRS
ncbi:MFS transporter [Streptomyces thinghirensis]|nr:MFS transporter [Streptomyces thinghirensis]